MEVPSICRVRIQKAGKKPGLIPEKFTKARETDTIMEAVRVRIERRGAQRSVQPAPAGGYRKTPAERIERKMPLAGVFRRTSGEYKAKTDT